MQLKGKILAINRCKTSFKRRVAIQKIGVRLISICCSTTILTSIMKNWVSTAPRAKNLLSKKFWHSPRKMSPESPTMFISTLKHTRRPRWTCRQPARLGQHWKTIARNVAFRRNWLIRSPPQKSVCEQSRVLSRVTTVYVKIWQACLSNRASAVVISIILKTTSKNKPEMPRKNKKIRSNSSRSIKSYQLVTWTTWLTPRSSLQVLTKAAPTSTSTKAMSTILRLRLYPHFPNLSGLIGIRDLRRAVSIKAAIAGQFRTPKPARLRWVKSTISSRPHKKEMSAPAEPTKSAVPRDSLSILIKTSLPNSPLFHRKKTYRGFQWQAHK